MCHCRTRPRRPSIQAKAYLDQFQGDEAAAYRLAAKSGELIDDEQWHAARMRKASPN
jgi:hypothetical protein